MADGFLVRHNIQAMFAHRQSTLNNGTISKAMERLSSGYRINRASDDAGGLAVSEKLRTQIRGFDQAAKNIQDGMSFIQTGDSALQTVHDILQRTRELLLQAANGVYTDTDRSFINLEIQNLMQEIDRIHTSTYFNQKRIFDHSTADIVWIIDNSVSMGPEQAELANVTAQAFFEDLERREISFRVATVGFSNAANTSVVGDFTTNLSEFATDVLNVGTAGSGFENGMGALTFSLGALQYRQNARKIFVILTDEDADDAGNNLAGGSSDLLSATNSKMVDNDVLVDVVTNTTITGAGANPALPADIEYRDKALQVSGDNGIGVPNATGGKTFTSLGGTFANDLVAQIDSAIGEVIRVQVGPNVNQKFASVLQSPISTKQLGLKNVSAMNQILAGSSISAIDGAINTLSKIRANLGAEMNRLQSTFVYAQIAKESLQAAESRIRDADMAAEIIEFTKAQVVGQSSNAMLAQANLMPQNVLSLLG
ncbi:flagellin [bacterium]|nr:flagellin [bacterium]